MILGKLWRSIKAQFNRLANLFRSIDPIAEMQYECDLATEQVKEGRRGLEMHRGLVERLSRQVGDGRKHVANLAEKVKSYLAAGDRATAGKFALELEKAKSQFAENEAQLKIHESAYENNLEKVKHASQKIAEARERVQQYDATLKMSKAEAEIAKLAQSLELDVTTDFGEVENIVQTKIDLNRAKVKVAADMSGVGLDEIRRDNDMEKARAEAALRSFEGAATPPA